MNIDAFFQSKYLKASDVDTPIKLTIETVGEEVMRDQGVKPVAFFREESRGLILNKTNSVTLKEAFGGNTDAWAGKTIRLVSEKVDFGCKRVDAIRVQVPKDGDVIDGDIPF